MRTMTISEVRNALPRVLAQLRESHEPVTILRYGKAIAKIVPVEDTGEMKYPLRGLPLGMTEDFNEPLPQLWDVFEQ
ncbi:MAG: type II toxin-antitoxin system Phd/YefM family antitoxin [Coriobacteriia bacterium]|nr:type II toxin-antitoxin system Phd/YefM family antitoxin [Coriobacteriia bacterium]